MSSISEKNNSAPLSDDGKKRKLWRNVFLLNLGVTLLLVGMFWLPLKVSQVDEFLNSSSIHQPQKGTEQSSNKNEATPEPAAPMRNPNMLETRYALINASSENDWVYFSFAMGTVVGIHDRTKSLDWDIAFRRGKAVTNGGATNKSGAGGVMDLGESSFDSIAEIPDEKFTEDTVTRTDTENQILNKWYRYNYFTHKLTARKNVYGFRTALGKYAKVQFLGFYCENKETGCINIQYVYQDNNARSLLKGVVSPPPATTEVDPVIKDS